MEQNAVDIDLQSSLKQKVVHTLEKQGLLGQLKAQLRSNVYHILAAESDPKLKLKQTTSPVLSTLQGELALLLIKDFLKTSGLSYTLSVLESEAHLSSLPHDDPVALAVEMGLSPSSTTPLLMQYLCTLTEKLPSSQPGTLETKPVPIQGLIKSVSGNISQLDLTSDHTISPSISTTGLDYYENID